MAGVAYFLSLLLWIGAITSAFDHRGDPVAIILWTACLLYVHWQL